MKRRERIQQQHEIKQIVHKLISYASESNSVTHEFSSVHGPKEVDRS